MFYRSEFYVINDIVDQIVGVLIYFNTLVCGKIVFHDLHFYSLDLNEKGYPL